MAMPAIPTAKEIKDRIQSDLETAFNQSTPALPRAFNKVIAGSLSGEYDTTGIVLEVG